MKVLVTGSAKGLGRQLAVDLGLDGHEVVVHYRTSRTAAESVVDLIHRGGGRAYPVRADVTVPTDV